MDISSLFQTSDEDKKSAMNMGLLQAGLGMLAANTDKSNPMRAIGLGGMQGLQGYQNSLQQSQADQMWKLQQVMLVQKLAEEQRRKAAMQKLGGTLNQNDQALFDVSPEKFIEKRMLADPKYQTVGNNLVRTDTPNPTVAFTAPEKAPEFVQLQNLYASMPEGPQKVQLGEYLKTKATHSPLVSVAPKVEVKMGESLGQQVGPMMKDAKIQTEGAVKMADAAMRIEKALDSGLVSAGPLTSQVMTVKQFLNLNPNSVRETRQVIRSLAEMSIEARKELAGQGQVTESEAKAVQKAMSGDINDLTVGELRDLATLTKRASAFRAQSYRTMYDEMANNPSTAQLAPFYKVRGVESLYGLPTDLPKIGGTVFDKADAILNRK